jgi:hypothetical protein
VPRRAPGLWAMLSRGSVPGSRSEFRDLWPNDEVSDDAYIRQVRNPPYHKDELGLRGVAFGWTQWITTPLLMLAGGATLAMAKASAARARARIQP